jgi:hypothetical protein
MKLISGFPPPPKAREKCDLTKQAIKIKNEDTPEIFPIERYQI